MKKDDEENNKNELLISTEEKDINNISKEKHSMEEDEEVKKLMQLSVTEPKNIDIDYYSSANCISSLFYYWAFKIIKLSHKVKINIHHLGSLKGKNSSINFMQHYYHIYQELNYKTKGLIWSIFRSNLRTVLLVLILGLSSTGINVVQMMIFKSYVALFKEDQIHDTEISIFIYYGVGFLITKLLNIFISKKINEYQNYIGFKAGVQLNCIIFDKLLVVSPSSRHNKAETGEIVNYVQVDSNQLIRFVTMSPSLLQILLIDCNQLGHSLLFLLFRLCYVYWKD